MTGLALRRVRKRGGLRFRGLLESLRRRQALLWLRLYRFRLFIQLQIAQHGASARLVLLITLVSAGALLIPFLQRSLATFFTTEQKTPRSTHTVRNGWRSSARRGRHRFLACSVRDAGQRRAYAAWPLSQN